MKIKLFSYNTLDTFVHKLSGVAKLVSFIALTSTVMLTFDIRIISFVFIFSLILFKAAKIQFKQVKLMFYYVWVFIALNFILTFLFAPTLGCDIYGTKHILFTITSRYVVTIEQLFYQVTKALKYLAIVPIGMVLLLTTNPSELASSMNAIGIPYKVCTTIALTLRYFPDVANDYTTISLAQQARGIELSGKAKLKDRFKHIVAILTPLIFTTVDRIDVVSNAMELRGYGKKKKRTWYSYRPLKRNDYLSIIVTVTMLVITILIRIYINHGVYYNPFI
jgi:energy-coupling factor transport system permease protein